MTLEKIQVLHNRELRMHVTEFYNLRNDVIHQPSSVLNVIKRFNVTLGKGKKRPIKTCNDNFFLIF